ncbi:Thioesterase/thiol ester dehydrase-isomerase [Rhizodiscina lignyota]|uniref:Thioesterase/thiol ester dehydrase-isomerase n=1 Tax=Rhizodiscina lignyota TaxID=1504668 RepID=A0A9P4M1I0_9PEZI|nr:Thioesterase/thiol ester dehydrase-isomerase [Rhizodiscina lignyota]
MQNFDSHVRRNVELLSVEMDENDPSVARSTFLLRVAPDICNAAGNLHGGFVALAFDMLTSLTVAPLAREDFWDSGHVSRTLNCTYMRPALEGSELLVESEVVHLGKRLGMLRGVMRDKETGKVCYACEHGKAAVVPEPPHNGNGNGKAKL